MRDVMSLPIGIVHIETEITVKSRQDRVIPWPVTCRIGKVRNSRGDARCTTRSGPTHDS